MYRNKRYAKTGRRALLVLIMSMLTLAIFIQGCSTTPISPEIIEQEEEDEREFDGSVFFHDDTEGIEDFIRDNDDDDDNNDYDDDKVGPDPKIAMPMQVQMAAERVSNFSKAIPAASLSAFEAPEVPVARVSVGVDHSLLLDIYGNVWASGKGNHGQLGNGLRSSFQFYPVRMESDIEDISAGGSHSLLLSSSGDVLAFGDNNYLQLGLENANEARTEPVIVAYDIQAIEAGLDHSLLLDIEGNLYRVGNQADIELEILGYSTDAFSINYNYLFSISAVPNLIAPRVIGFASDYRFTMYIQEDLRLWASGKNNYGQLGDGTTQDREYPVLVMYDVAKVSTSMDHALIIDVDNRLWSVGNNSNGQLGNGTLRSSSVPIHIMDNIVSVSAGDTRSLALDSDGVLWGFGNIYLDEMPPGSEYNLIEPFPLLHNVAVFSTGYGSTLAVTYDGSLWALGDNRNGELGLEGSEFIKTFTQVEIHLPELGPE